MHVSFPGRLLPALLVAAALLAGCGDDDPAAPVAPAGIVPDFALKDVNSTSATYDADVSPRDYLQQVSAWYFGHAT